MAKYEIKWTEETWYSAIVEAKSKKEAEENFWEDYPSNAKAYGGETQQNIDVEKVEE